jgi:hypothetical protein
LYFEYKDNIFYQKYSFREENFDENRKKTRKSLVVSKKLRTFAPAIQQER